MTLSQKILSLPIIVALFMLGLSTIVISRLTDIDTSVKLVTRTLAPEASESAAQMQNFMERDRLVHSYLQTNDPVHVERFKDLRADAILIARNFRDIRTSTDGIEKDVQNNLLSEIESRDAKYSQIFLDTIVENNIVANSTASKLLDVIGPSIVKSLSDTVATALSDDKQAIVSAASSALRSFQTARIFVGQFLLSNSASDASRVEMQLLGVDNSFYDLAKLVSEPRRLALTQNAKNNFDIFSNDFNSIVSAVNTRNRNLSGVLSIEIESIKELTIGQQIEVWNGLNASGTLVEGTVKTTIDNVLITTGIAIILGMIPAFFVTRNIKRAIRNTVTIADGIAHGELDQDIKIDSKDEAGQLLSSLDVMVNQLTHVVSKIQSSATTVKLGASEISKGNQDLSKSTEEQVTRLSDTSTQIAELNVTVKQNTSDAIQASDLANAARLRAEDSSKVISKTVSAMADINNSSNEISKIIGLIDDIAFQTNLLALNAAVEAARAGESGRGFAVVATEVRSLAGRSAEAASEIKSLITDSNQNVELGTELVNRSRDSLSEIVTEVTKVSDVVNDIAAASKQQSISIHHVSETINVLNQLTNNNTELVDKLASAGRLLSGESEALSGMTAFFKSTKTPEKSEDDLFIR